MISHYNNTIFVQKANFKNYACMHACMHGGVDRWQNITEYLAQSVV